MPAFDVVSRVGGLLLVVLGLTLFACSAWVDTDKLGDPPTVGGPAPDCATGCDDGINCTVDECILGSCVFAANSTICGAQQICDLRRGCVASACTDGSCVCEGSDCPGGSCTVDKEDKDGDGHTALVIGQPGCGDDCQDEDGSVYGGARELCNGQDDDCDGVVDDGCVNAPPLCQNAQPLVFTGGRALVEGKLGGAGGRPNTSCGKGTGRAVVYSLEVQTLSDIIIDTAGSSFPTLLAVGADCSNERGFNLGCAGQQGKDSTRTRLIIHRFDPAVQRKLFILVDSLGPLNGGNFKLSVVVQPAASYSCVGAPLNISEGGTLVGFMSSSGVSNGNCMGPVLLFNEPEAVVRYAATTATRLRCTATSDAFDPALYAQSPCGGLLPNELGCTRPAPNSGKAELTLNLMANSNTFLFIDNGENGGKYELTCTAQ